MDSTFLAELMTKGLDIGLKVMGAIIVWIVGSWLIGMVRRMMTSAMTAKEVDVTQNTSLRPSAFY